MRRAARCRAAAGFARAAPFISVIVPIRNEAPFIQHTLDSLLRQKYDLDRFEVIVADGDSNDGTPDLVRSMQPDHPNLRLLHNPKRWSSAGRNIAVQAARSDYVVVVDGHTQLDNAHYLESLADAFHRSGADCVGRPQPLDITGATPLQRAIAMARSSRLGHHPASWIYACREGFVRPQSVGIAYRREVFETVGFFDEEFDACEDVEFNHRVDAAGLTCYFTPLVEVRYHPRASLGGLFKQLCRYGRGRARLLWKHPRTFSLSSITPALFLLAVVFGACLAWMAPVFAVPYFVAIYAYVGIVAGHSLWLSFRARDLRLLPWLPCVFAMIHGGAGAGVLIETFRQLSRIWMRRPDRNAATVPSLPRVFPAPQAPNRPLDRTQSPVLNSLTVDVEDYFQVTGFESFIDRSQWEGFESRVSIGMDRIMRALDTADVRATFFVLGWIAERNPQLVRRLVRAGHEVGCHSYCHRLVYQQTPDEFREDLRRARTAIEDAAGVGVSAYRAPCFSITHQSLWALDILIDEGFRFDSSIYPTLHDRYGIPGALSEPHEITRPAGALWEFPMAVYRAFGYPFPVGGGGYFRLYPYALTRHMLQRMNQAGRPFVVYLHPWELDPEQPRLRPRRMSAFRHYVNLHRTEPRLNQLLRDFRFGTISDVHSSRKSSRELPKWNLTAAA